MESLTKMRFLIKKVNNCITSIKHEIKKEETTLKGEIFEEYVRNYLFPKNRYDLLYRTPAYDSSDFVKSLTFPDFHFQCKETGKRICVEAKYRKSCNSTTYIEICKDGQLKRYKEFGVFQNSNVYIVMGVGLNCHDPEDLYLIPISKRESIKVPISELSMYRVNRKHVINLSFIKSLE